MSFCNKRMWELMRPVKLGPVPEILLGMNFDKVGKEKEESKIKNQRVAAKRLNGTLTDIQTWIFTSAVFFLRTDECFAPSRVQEYRQEYTTGIFFERYNRKSLGEQLCPEIWSTSLMRAF